MSWQSTHEQENESRFGATPVLAHGMTMTGQEPFAGLPPRPAYHNSSVTNILNKPDLGILQSDIILHRLLPDEYRRLQSELYELQRE